MIHKVGKPLVKWLLDAFHSVYELVEISRLLTYIHILVNHIFAHTPSLPPLYPLSTRVLNPRSFWDTVLYGNKLRELPVCRALDSLSWGSDTWASLGQWAQSLL